MSEARSVSECTLSCLRFNTSTQVSHECDFFFEELFFFFFFSFLFLFFFFFFFFFEGVTA